MEQATECVFDVAETSSPEARERTVGRSFRCAIRGLREAWDHEPNFRLHATAAAGVLTFGLLVHLSAREWLWVALAIGLVLVAELLNTAIERVVDLAVGLRPDPLARQTKDLAASFVLVSCLLATAIGLLTILPRLLAG